MKKKMMMEPTLTASDFYSMIDDVNCDIPWQSGLPYHTICRFVCKLGTTSVDDFDHSFHTTTDRLAYLHDLGIDVYATTKACHDQT